MQDREYFEAGKAAGELRKQAQNLRNRYKAKDTYVIEAMERGAEVITNQHNQIVRLISEQEETNAQLNRLIKLIENRHNIGTYADSNPNF